jgi:meso-butanediol dehydrogenase/(S,S)-butanediol dehydrogenase/diacetyl reductase
VTATADDRTVLVTGAAGGIGRAIVERLAADGVRVVAADLDAVRAEEVAAGLGGDHLALAFDVRDADAVARAADALAAQAGGLDGLVVAAGVEHHAPLGETTPEVWTKLVETNLTGSFLCLRACLPLLRARRGATVMIASPGGRAVWPGASAYAASKAGVEGLVRAAAIDLAGEGLRVNAVVPGTTDTPLLRAVTPDGEDPDAFVRAVGCAIPLGRVAAPFEVAAVVAFLLGDDARYVTGASWEVDGGLLARLGTDV